MHHEQVVVLKGTVFEGIKSFVSKRKGKKAWETEFCTLVTLKEFDGF